MEQTCRQLYVQVVVACSHVLSWRPNAKLNICHVAPCMGDNKDDFVRFMTFAVTAMMIARCGTF